LECPALLPPLPSSLVSPDDSPLLVLEPPSELKPLESSSLPPTAPMNSARSKA